MRSATVALVAAFRLAFFVGAFLLVAFSVVGGVF
jgi:hypothetical protein